MADYGHNRTYGDRKIEIVRGKTFSANTTRLEPRTSPAPPFAGANSSKAKRKGNSISKSWNDPEMKRRRRIASYKAYALEGKVKASFSKSIRWIKDKCSGLIHGC